MIGMKRGLRPWCVAVRPHAAACGVLLCALLLPTRPANADEDDGIRFVYERRPGAESCPEPEAVRASIAQLSGSDPFDEQGPRVLECTMEQNDGVLTATVALSDASGHLLGRRILQSDNGDCRELASKLTLVVAMALAKREPWLLGDDASSESTDSVGEENAGDLADDEDELAAEEPAAAPAPDTPEDVSVGAQVTPHRAAPVVPFVDAGIAALATTNSHIGGSLRVGAGLRRGGKSLELELRLDTADKTSVADGGSVSAWSGGLALLPCGHLGSVSACGLVAAGLVRGKGHDLTISRSATTPRVTAGGRLAWHAAVGRRVGIRVFADLEGSLSKTTFLVDSEPAWSSPAVAFALGCAAVGHFP